ncbi:hypothetical protein LR48_Vigan401s000300 [Vigna angularis]|uniref:Uncharacterized protein n=1 Tax=Phaseolus angularis TaxID=3914 RepID=A0A0L9T941_PHAAN|nr:hypothetical protein LR48_Vigan401s000300 [Vigna angularis]
MKRCVSLAALGSCVGFEISKVGARVRIEREREITRERERSREKKKGELLCCHRRLDVIGKVCTSEGEAEGKVRTGRDRCGARKVITEVYVSNEEMCTEIVKEGLDGHHNAGLKENLQRRSMADIVAENEAFVAIIVDQEASIGKLEKMVDNLSMFVAQKRQHVDDVTNSNSNKKCDMLVHEFGTSSSQEHYEVVVSSIGKSNSKKESEIEGDRVEKSNSENVFDVTPAVGKSFIENGGDVLGHAEMPTEKSDMYTRLKAQPRKRVRSVLLKI